MNPIHVIQEQQDAQADAYLQMEARALRAERERDEARAQVEAAAAQTVELQAGYATQRRKLADEVYTLKEKNTQQREVIDRFRKEQMQLVRALRALRDVVMEGKVSCDSIEWPGEVFRAVQDAEEVLKLCEVPFG